MQTVPMIEMDFTPLALCSALLLTIASLQASTGIAAACIVWVISSLWFSLNLISKKNGTVMLKILVLVLPYKCIKYIEKKPTFSCSLRVIVLVHSMIAQCTSLHLRYGIFSHHKICKWSKWNNVHNVYSTMLSTNYCNIQKQLHVAKYTCVN